MMNHSEIELIKSRISNTQYKMLIAIADYNEGWIDENQLEKRLQKILKCK